MLKKMLTLSPLEKSRIVEIILQSLDQPDAHIEELWNREVDSRLDAIKQGFTQTIPYEKVF